MNMQNVLNKTDDFSGWIDGLKAQKGQARVLSRIVVTENGNFGDCGPVGEGESEMRVHYGPGYRVYFAGGDKGTQERDVKLAKAMRKDLKKVGGV